VHEGTDFARITYADLQNMVTEDAQPNAFDDQLSAAMIAEAEQADEHTRVHGCRVHRRVE
jgi:hypothetical protein